MAGREVGRVHFLKGCQVGNFFSKCARGVAESIIAEGWQVGK